MGGVVLSHGAVVGVGWCSPPTVGGDVDRTERRGSTRGSARLGCCIASGPAVASHERSVVGPGVGDDAPADTGRPGDRSVAAVPRTLSVPGGVRRRTGRRCRRGVGRSRLQPASAQPSSRRNGDGRDTRWPGAGTPRRSPRPARRGSLHRQSGAGLRPRASGGGRRHQHRPGPGSLGRHPAHPEPGSTTR